MDTDVYTYLFLYLAHSPGILNSHGNYFRRIFNDMKRSSIISIYTSISIYIFIVKKQIMKQYIHTIHIYITGKILGRCRCMIQGGMGDH